MHKKIDVVMANIDKNVDGKSCRICGNPTPLQ